jgi:cysteine desulfurase / selenocysteine lyase
MEMRDARDQFPAMGKKTFLDAACVSLAPKRAVEAIQDFLEMAMHCPSVSSTRQHIAMDELRAEARPEAARLIGAAEDEIALVESTSHGLTLAAESIPLVRGDRILICDLEFLQVAVPWCQKRVRDGIEVDLVHNREGRILTDDIEAAITPRTRVFAISSVQWSNGYRCNLEAVSAMCRDRNIWLVVDAIQQIGAIPIDVRKSPVDFLACGGHKWLNSPFGTGFLYIRRDRLDLLRKPLAGYMSMKSPEGGWENYFQTPSIHPVRDFEFSESVSCFETGGTSNYPGAIGLAASLKLIHDVGQEQIANHVRALTDYLMAGLRLLRVSLVTPPEPECRSGIVTFCAGSREKNIELMNRLLERKVLVSVRYTSGIGGIRVSCHLYNNISDLDRLLNVLEDSL